MRICFCWVLVLVMWVGVVGSIWADTPKTIWDSHDELLEWIALATKGDTKEATGVYLLLDGDRSYVRLLWQELPERTAIIAYPASVYSGGPLDSVDDLPDVLDPAEYNALRITLRQTMGADSLGMLWYHRGRPAEWDEDDYLPVAEPQPSNSDGQWHDVLIRMDSAVYYQPDKPVVLLFVAIGDRGKAGSTADEIPAGAFLDIDRIKLVRVEDTSPTPTITGFSPQKGSRGTEITISGSGFAEPANRNYVFVGTQKAEVVSGSSTSLVARVRGSQHAKVIVRTTGGKEAASEEEFVFVFTPRTALVVSGQGQSAEVGSTLDPMSVKIVDMTGQGVPDVDVEFRIATGSGSLSTTSSRTDNDGIASTILTLGYVPGTVTIEAKVYGLKRRLFSATAYSK